MVEKYAERDLLGDWVIGVVFAIGVSHPPSSFSTLRLADLRLADRGARPGGAYEFEVMSMPKVCGHPETPFEALQAARSVGPMDVDRIGKKSEEEHVDEA